MDTTTKLLGSVGKSMLTEAKRHEHGKRKMSYGEREANGNLGERHLSFDESCVCGEPKSEHKVEAIGGSGECKKRTCSCLRFNPTSGEGSP